MERKRTIFFGSLQTFLKFLLHAGISLLFVVSYHVTLLSASTENYHGKRLNQLGHEQLQKGEAQKALKTWEQAYEIYRGLNNSEGVSGTLINQSLALQALGSYSRACRTINEALKLEKQNWVCNSRNNINSQSKKKLITALEGIPQGKIQIIGLENLGDILNQIGKVEASEIVLEKTLSMTKKNKNFSTDNILLKLGNGKSISYKKELSKYKVTDDPLDKQKALELAKINFKSALSFYQQSINISNDSNIKALAQLNELDLLLNSDFKIPERKLKIENSVNQLLRANFKGLPVIELIYSQIRFSKYLIKIASDEKLNYIISDSELSIAVSSGLSALNEANKTDDKMIKSLVFGNLAKTYNYLGKFEESKKFLEQALSLAESIQAWDISYEWEQELGRIYEEAGNPEQAKHYYDFAIKSIEKIESNYDTLSDSEVRLYFKERIEPVYQEYLEILLSDTQPDFVKIIKVRESLQLNEIKNFLRCNFLLLIPEDKIQPDSKDIKPTIYIFQLKNKIEVIVKTSSGLFFKNEINNPEEVISSGDNLMKSLQSPYFFKISEAEFLYDSQKLYKLLIKPIEKYLPNKGDLSFVTDSYFQKIPFSSLNNGEKYLLEDYNISVSLRSKNFNQSPRKLKAFIAGIYESNPNFNHPSIGDTFTPLPEVREEILSIEKSIIDKKELINSEFNSKNFQKWIRKKENDFPIFHVSTHGQFSSDPQKTFVIAWDKPINVREFEHLLVNHPNKIDLLVLSACQTAKGDKYSGLGIAGVSIMSGAKSTLASLWLVDAKSTAILMGDFYRGLRNGLDEPKALQEAQIALAKNPRYSHPYYWAPFILVSQ